jgi:hypothetical protein
MSATPGKVCIDGVAEVAGEKVFVLRFLQGRNPAWAGRPFFARYDPEATWLDQLRPAFGGERFFFQDELEQIKLARRAPPWGERIVPRRKSAVFGHVEWE